MSPRAAPRLVVAVALAVIAAIACLLAHAGPARATEPPGPLTLAACLRLAEHNAPVVQAQAARLQAAAGALALARTAPNPVASYTAQDLGTPALLHQAQLAYPLFFGVARAPAVRAARVGQAEAEALVAEDLRRLHLAMGRAYYGDPVPPGTSYDRRCRLEEVARKMKQRGFFHRLLWNHPDVIRGGRDCFLTPLGAAAVAVLDAPAPRRVRPATGKRRP